MSKTYELRETKHPHLSRVVDRHGDWTHYFLKLPGMDDGIYLRSVNHILDKGYAKGEGLLRFLSQHTEKERDEILTRAGDKGDMVHRAIDLMCSGAPKLERDIEIHNRLTNETRKLSNDEWDALLSWSRFWADHKPLIYANETPIYCLEGGYAGTADTFVSLQRECENKRCCCHGIIGKIGVLDYKTSAGIYSSYWAQQAAYAYGDNVKEYLPKGKMVEWLGILRIGTNHKTTGGYEFKTRESLGMSSALTRFFAAKTIADEEYTPFSAEEIEDVPDVIEVDVEHYVAPVVEEKPVSEKKVSAKVRKVAKNKLKKQK